MKFKLPELPYAMNALAPVISQETLEFHYSKHHKAYIDKMNELVVGTEFENKNLEEIVLKSSGPLFNNAGQSWNHCFYWHGMSPESHAPTSGPLFEALKVSFGSVEDFKKKFNEKTVGVFGSGWGWLVQKPDGRLEIVGTSNAENPMRTGDKPLFVCDVWEHAYYIDYRNLRAKYLENYWQKVNWKFIEANFLAKETPNMTQHMKA